MIQRLPLAGEKMAMLLLYASISKLYRRTTYKAYLEISVGVVKKCHSHQKCCGGTACAPV